MRLASRVFRGAAIYGVVVLLPMYLIPLPDPYKLTQTGFVGLALVFQGVFWLIGGDPLHYRRLMPLAVAEKVVFGIPAVVLFVLGRSDVLTTVFGAMDLILAGLFLWVIARLRRTAA